MMQNESGTCDEPDRDRIFSRRLRDVRIQAGMPQRVLALLVTAAGHQMHQTTIAKIELGERPVQLGEASALARALGVDLDGLIRMPCEGEHEEFTRALAEHAGLRQRVLRLTGNVVEAQGALQAASAALAEADARIRELSKGKANVNGDSRVPFHPVTRGHADFAVTSHDHPVETGGPGG
jgi:transcriptional regulator with XRE-family HTH domain